MKSGSVLILIFLLSNLVGIYVGSALIPVIQEQYNDISPVTGQPVESPSNAAFFFIYVLLATGAIILVLVVYKGVLIFRVFEFFVIFFGAQIVYDVFLSNIINFLYIPITQNAYEYLIIILAAATAVVRIVKRTPFIANVTLLIAVTGVGALLGSTLGLWPSLILVVALSIYDALSVFGTKHMVFLARESKRRQLPVMFQTGASDFETTKKMKTVRERKQYETVALGTGDIALPLTLYVSLLRSFTLDYALFAMIGGIVGLSTTLFYIANIRRIALPALPPIIGFSLLFLGAYYGIVALL